MNKIIIELEFDERPNEAEVINYLNDLITLPLKGSKMVVLDKNCLGYYEVQKKKKK